MSTVNHLIKEVRAREVLDSRGRPTVEAEVALTGGAVGRASIPSGASTGKFEACELRDCDPTRYRGRGVLKAVRNVGEIIAPAIGGMDANDQRGIDEAMTRLDGTPTKSVLGANAILAVSLAVKRAAAAAAGIPVWQSIASGERPLLPMPMVNMISGGLHAARILDIQDFLVIPVGAKSHTEALMMCVEIHAALGNLLRQRDLSTLKADEGGYAPRLKSNRQALDLLMEAVAAAGFVARQDIAFAIDVAASHFYNPIERTYRLEIENATLDADGMIELLESWVRDYPVASIEDGLSEDDWPGWQKLTERLGSSVQLIGDDLFVTNSERLQRGIESGVANAILVKMNQIGTLTETLDVVAQAKRAGYRTIISARSGETEDPFLAQLAVGCAGGQIKVGSVFNSERLAKYNELLRIEEQVGSEHFAGCVL